MTEFQFFAIGSLLFLILIFSWIDARRHVKLMNQVIVRLDDLKEIASSSDRNYRQ